MGCISLYSYVDLMDVFVIFTVLISLAYWAFIAVCNWQLFKKAGRPGWAALIPIYDVYMLNKIVIGTGWFFLLVFAPCGTIVYPIMLYYNLGKVYGRSTAFSMGLIFLTPIFKVILAFSKKSNYSGPAFVINGKSMAVGNAPQNYDNMNNTGNFSGEQLYAQNSNPYNDSQKAKGDCGREQYFGQNGYVGGNNPTKDTNIGQSENNRL